MNDNNDALGIMLMEAKNRLSRNEYADGTRPEARFDIQVAQALAQVVIAEVLVGQMETIGDES